MKNRVNKEEEVEGAVAVIMVLGDIIPRGVEEGRRNGGHHGALDRIFVIELGIDRRIYSIKIVEW